MSNFSDFIQTGFPVIAVLAAAIYLALFFLSTGFKVPAGMKNLVLVATAFFDVITAIFLFWGPSAISSMGVHFFFYGLNSLYGAIGGKSEAIKLAPVYGALIVLMCIGSYDNLLSLGGYSFIEYQSTGCNNDLGATKPLDRCKDDGYLGFLRVMGTLAIFSTIINIVISCFDTEGEASAAPAPTA